MFAIHFLVLGTCKSISELFKWDATLVPTVKKDWDQAQRHIFHQDQKEEEGLSKTNMFKGLFSLCYRTPPVSDKLYGRVVGC